MRGTEYVDDNFYRHLAEVWEADTTLLDGILTGQTSDAYMTLLGIFAEAFFEGRG